MELIVTPAALAEEIMQKDALLLASLEHNPRPILHHYEWKGDSATYGYFINPSQYLNLEAAQTKGLSLARRPTGGGIIFHLTDLAFSILIPAQHPAYSIDTLANYRFVNQIVIQAIQKWLNLAISPQLLDIELDKKKNDSDHFCMAKPTKYDVMLAGKKIGGAAQRRTKWGFLHQGTINLSLPDRAYISALLNDPTAVWDSMLQNSYSLLKADSCTSLEDARSQLRHFLYKELIIQC